MDEEAGSRLDSYMTKAQEKRFNEVFNWDTFTIEMPTTTIDGNTIFILRNNWDQQWQSYHE